MSDWDDLQHKAYDDIWAVLDKGARSVVGVGPTGFGKTRLAIMMCQEADRRGWPWIFYTHRKTLFQQTHKRFEEAALGHGCRASGYESALDRSGQLAMFQTESAAIPDSRSKHDARLVIVDEAHCNKTGFAESVLKEHNAEGAQVVGLTATPVGISHLYDEMATFAYNSDLRRVGGIVLADSFAPSEFDLSDVRRVAPGGDFSQAAQTGKVMVQQVVGNIVGHFLQINPDMKPSLGFAPCVKSAQWFVDQFCLRGIPAASIDGENVYWGNRHLLTGEPELVRSTQKEREKVFEASRTGKIKIIWNRFVMREGIDLPYLEHGVFACAFGAPESWVQAVGRLLRSDGNRFSKVTIQDHGGNLRRAGLGSPNADRMWALSHTNASIVKGEADARKEGTADTPRICGVCHRPSLESVWKKHGWRCPSCGAYSKDFHTPVIQTDGKLKKVKDTEGIRRLQSSPVQKLWDGYFFRMRKGESNFNQLRSWFEREQPYRIDRTGNKTMAVCKITGDRHRLGYVPEANSDDWGKAVSIVPFRNLQAKVKE